LTGIGEILAKNQPTGLTRPLQYFFLHQNPKLCLRSPFIRHSSGRPRGLRRVGAATLPPSSLSSEDSMPTSFPCPSSQPVMTWHGERTDPYFFPRYMANTELLHIPRLWGQRGVQVTTGPTRRCAVLVNGCWRSLTPISNC
jgi:hypothetical protein